MTPNPHRRHRVSIALLVALGALAAACGSDGTTTETTETTETTTAASQAPVQTDAPTATEAVVETTATTAAPTATEAPAETQLPTTEAPVASSEPTSFIVETWADNWFALYVNGEFIGEDSVPITTERSFNAETFTFEATYPLTIAIEAKDFKETDSGIEYIGEGNQQMGDGGLIAQFTNSSTGEVVAVTNGDWAALAVHRAPLNKDCEKDPDPDATCEVEITETPSDWTSVAFDDSAWPRASEWSAGDVGPKDGYDKIEWDASATLIWGTDLEIDNTVLFRTTVDEG